jgi:putative nucleotidyltransferase with HDIG domain
VSGTTINESEYVSFSLAKIAPDRVLDTEIFLFISDHYVKFKSAGDLIPAEKYQFFHAKNLKEIYVRKEDVQKMNNWINSFREELSRKIQEDLGPEAVSIAEMDHEIREIVFDVFSDQELNSHTVSVLQKNASDFVQELASNPTIAQFLIRLGKNSGSLVDHCVNTANLSVFISMLNGIATKSELELIYTAAIFHDCYKSKIPPAVLENENSPSYVMAINDHPKKSAEMVLQISSIPPSVSKIIEQHHEQHNGQGYPNKLSLDGILPMAQFLSIANIYENELTKNKSKEEIERHRKAVKLIEYDRGKNFKPDFVKRTVDGLKLAFANFRR